MGTYHKYIFPNKAAESKYAERIAESMKKARRGINTFQKTIEELNKDKSEILAELANPDIEPRLQDVNEEIKAEYERQIRDYEARVQILKKQIPILVALKKKYIGN